MFRQKPVYDDDGVEIAGPPSIWNAIWGDATVADRLRFIRITFRFLVFFHIAWACGWLVPFGIYGFAWARDVKSDREVSHAELITPINRKLAEMDGKIEEALRLQRKLLVGQLTAQLRDLNRMRCNTTDLLTRVRLEQDIEEAQNNYRFLTQERYPITLCKDM
jgi:hypothetical protein